MVPGPPELEERYRRFLEGRGDCIAPLLFFLRSDGSTRAETEAWAALILSRIYLLRGAIDLASSFLRIAVSRSGGAPETLRLGILVNHALVRKARGRTAEAGKILRAVVDRSLRARETLVAAKAASNAALCLARLGDPVEAGTYAGLAERIYRSIGEREGLLRLSLTSAVIDAAAGRRGEAIHRLAAVACECGETERERERLAALVLMCEFHLAGGDIDRAVRSIELAEAMQSSLERFAPQRARLLHLRHIICQAVGDERGAQDYAERSERVRGAFGLGPDAAVDAVVSASGETDLVREAPLETPAAVAPRAGVSWFEAASDTIAAESQNGEERFVTCDTAMMQVFGRIRRAASLDVPILVCGETGTGKELVARLVHRWSGRSDEPFVPVNVASIPAELFESVLFGHARGSFTGAVCARAGLVASAAAGTLFLDEIGELPVDLQPKLLRFIDRGEYLPLGETRPRRCAARIVCATNRDLEAACAAGSFRGDLYHRIAAISFRIPPLRERRGDIVPLARHLLERLRRRHRIGALRIHPCACSILARLDWPGNARELERAILEAALRCRGGLIRAGDLPVEMLAAPAPEDAAAGDLRLRERSLRRDAIIAALRDCGGNRTRAAAALGVRRTTLIGMMKRLGIA